MTDVIVEKAAQALFERECQRAAARGHDYHHKPGTPISAMPSSYRDDYLADARAMLDALSSDDALRLWTEKTQTEDPEKYA